MIRKASLMTVYKEHLTEYKHRHDELWPEMEKELKAHGAHNYSIFLEESTGRLFAYVEIENEQKWNQMAETDICQKWWEYMEPLMETNPDNSPIAIALTEVFHLR